MLTQVVHTNIKTSPNNDADTAVQNSSLVDVWYFERTTKMGMQLP